MNFNKVFLLGNLATDVELRTLPSGQSIASFRVATNRVYKDNQGNVKKDAQFHNVIVFGRLADIASKYLSKGNTIFIEGRLNHRTYQDSTGNKKYWTEIIAETMQLPPKKWNQEKSELSELNASEIETGAKDVPTISDEDPFGEVDEPKDSSFASKEKDQINVDEDLPF
jgi:single-strand DNA-binding protein